MASTNLDPLNLHPISLRQPSIQVLTAIQSHGILLVLQEPSLTVLQVSNNTFGVFGIAPAQMLGKLLEQFLGVFQVEKIRAELRNQSFDHSNYTKVQVLKAQDNYSIFDAVFHHNPDGYLILELEPTQPDEHIPFQSFYHLAKASMLPLISLPTNQERGFTEGRSTTTLDLPAFGRIMVAEIRKLTGFDRVMVYKFDGDGHGEVIAEDKVIAMESYLGLHFPESDIPQPAREMFLSNRIRAISDVYDDAAQLIPAHNPLTERPTDLSRSRLRSADPCHIEYLQNMGVSASLTISLIKNGRLWGIITCHHQTAKLVSYELQNACELLGQVIFDRISIIEDIPDYSYRSKLAHLRSMGIDQMSQFSRGETPPAASFVDALMGQSPNLLDLFDAWGAAIYFGGQWTAVGQTPSPAVLNDLVQWLTKNVEDDVFATDSLPLLAADFFAGAQFKDVASGLLAISLSPYSYVLCFRPEVIQTVNWGGNRDRAYQEVIEADGNVRLSPRKSFQLWQEQVRLHALPWQAAEIAAAVELRRSLVNIILSDDINQQKQTENSLRESEARYRTLVATAPVGIFQTDISGNCLFINQQCLELIGAPQAEVLGQNWTNSVHPDDRAQVFAEWDRMVQTAPLEKGISQRGFRLEYRLVTPQGQINWVSGNAIAIDDQTGNITGYLGTVTNITEKKQLEQQFLRVQRLESLGTLASGIAHDLNNVLTPIVGAAELLPLTLPTLDDRSQKLLTMLVESSLRGSSLVKQILTFARGMDGQRIVLQVHHILAEIISVARQTFPKSIKINLDLPAEDLWMVYVDATQIHQVLMNLFVNARDAIPDGGSITTTARNLVLAGTDVNVRDRSYVVITVADTGTGMDSETIDQIFDLFFTTKEMGTGLGLSTVLSIIKAHDGFIDVDSEVGRGTCFKIYLPAVNNREEQQPVEQPELFDGNKQLILVVDDEFLIREIIKDSLETYNYRVMLASDGVEAISMYNQDWSQIAVVLLDMMMPNLHTPHIIQVLQQINPTVKIVAMSGTSANESIVDRYALGAFLTKPFTTTEMLHTLANLHHI